MLTSVLLLQDPQLSKNLRGTSSAIHIRNPNRILCTSFPRSLHIVREIPSFRNDLWVSIVNLIIGQDNSFYALHEIFGTGIITSAGILLLVRQSMLTLVYLLQVPRFINFMALTNILQEHWIHKFPWNTLDEYPNGSSNEAYRLYSPPPPAALVNRRDLTCHLLSGPILLLLCGSQGNVHWKIVFAGYHSPQESRKATSCRTRDIAIPSGWAQRRRRSYVI